MPLNKGARLPQTTQAFRAVANGTHGFNRLAETHPHAWTSYPDIDMFEQTRLAPNGHAVTLLWAELPEDDRTKMATRQNSDCRDSGSICQQYTGAFPDRPQKFPVSGW
ncbi:hypothetical protein FGK63_08365 [Ruegeria sediminis]|uniref:Uncharacterized protein n=1 Tax=Ruegeria sediminis TaxID=2583820 RepID=A0ABY2X1K9_9RHOB|nr:hypothetical protein FGK63_08365 [Ruegeria sediminis]